MVPGIRLRPEREAAELGVREVAEEAAAGGPGVDRVRLALAVEGQALGAVAGDAVVEVVDLAGRQSVRLPGGVALLSA